MSDEQLEYSAKLLANNISLEKRNKEIYEGFMATTEELCEATKEIERLNNIINEFNKLIENEINESKLEDNYERVDSLEYCLATLKELKGSDK